MKNFKNKVAAITGAGSGIGQQLAVLLAKQGCHLSLSDVNEQGLANSAQSNKLQGSVTVTVIQRQPNGNLVVQGQKNLRLNRGDELVQIQGIVRAADIAPDNTIPSSKVADARIAYGGRGQITDVQQPRYGQQVADIILPF